jgi:PrgI family protein
MARHTVPQDVETADKLIGFLSLKQFLFVLAGCGMLFLAYTFARINILLGIPFLPFIGVAFVLGLYQRHDQPAEVFLASWLKFKFAPKIRIWGQEGYEQHVIVTVPKKEVIDYTKGLSQKEVYSSFTGLGSKLDTRGWSTKGVSAADSKDLGTGESERLISLDEVEVLQEKYAPKYTPPTDIFDANNSPVASRIEVDIDKASQATNSQATQLLTVSNDDDNDSADSNTMSVQHGLKLKPQQTTQINNLAKSDAPISTVASQAGEAIRVDQLDKGAEFSLR